MAVRLSIVAALAVATAAVAAGLAPARGGADCSRTSVALTPLTDFGGTRKYRGFTGGLYGSGSNAPPPRYLRQGLAAAGAVTPRAADGTPSSGGRVVLLSIGMSNATQEFSVFKQLAEADPLRDPAVAVVDGAQGGQDAERVADPAAPFWAVVDQRLAAAGTTRAQVQVVWLKQALRSPTESFPADARRLQSSLRRIVEIVRDRFPNVKLVYLSSRTYAGYATTELNPEPWAYQSAFAVRWTIYDRVAGRVRGPWLGWGPYLWTNGVRGRKDGLVWRCDDTAADGTHPSPAGRQKVAELLLRFFRSDRTAKVWYLR